MTSIRRKPSGKWEARYRDTNGRQRGASFAKKIDASRFLERVGADLQRGGYVDPRGGRVALEDYSRTWLERRSDLRPSTRGKYAQLLRLHLVPTFGKIELAKLAPSTVRRWYQDLQRAHPVTADDAYRLLRAILNTAVADELIASNSCKVKGAGQVRSPERPIATVAELAGAVAAMPEPYRAAILLAAWCQLRRGEVLGLTRRDVDLLHATVRVERAWVPPPGGKAAIGPPKTERGTRTLAIPANAIPALRHHLAGCPETGPDVHSHPPACMMRSRLQAIKDTGGKHLASDQ